MTEIKPLRCGWLGPHSGGLGWLCERIESFRPPELQMVLSSDRIDVHSLERLAEDGLDRLVLACSDRLSFPVKELAWMQQHCPEIPLALAVDQWWDGSRRTGAGSAGHVQLPWYRWWDGWTDWLCGRSAEWYQPCPLPNQQVSARNHDDRSQNDWDAPVHAGLRRGLVVANCRQSGEAWSLAGQAYGATVRLMSASQFAAAGAQIESEVDWILWDDTCLDTSLGVTAEEQSTAFFAALGAAVELRVAIAAVSLPRIDWWRQLEMTCPGRVELLVKPNDGLGLARLLAGRGANHASPSQNKSWL